MITELNKRLGPQWAGRAIEYICVRVYTHTHTHNVKQSLLPPEMSVILSMNDYDTVLLLRAIISSIYCKK
jgi:hypothetical protein